MKIAHSSFAISILSGVFFLSPATAQNSAQPTLKGHSIGESAAIFLAHSPTTRAARDACQNGSSSDHNIDPWSAAERYRKELSNGTSCDTLVHIRFDDPHITFHLINPSERVMFDSIAGNDKTAVGVLDFIGSVNFTDGRLDLIEVQQSGSWDDLQHDFEQKFGQPTHTFPQEVQNGYGAHFTLMKVEWDRPDHIVIATEGMTSALVHSFVIEMMSPSFYKHYQNGLNQRKNSLD